MKLKVLHRNARDYISQGPHDRPKPMRNLDPNLHPLARQKEFVRAVVAAKLKKMHAKPFVAALEGHTDSVDSMSMSRSNISDLFTGSCNGEIMFWNLLTKRKGILIGVHEGFVKGLCTNGDGTLLYSCGHDKYLKCWKVIKNDAIDEIEEDEEATGHSTVNEIESNTPFGSAPPEPLESCLSKSALNAIDHHWNDNILATAGDCLEVWDSRRSVPIMKFDWDSEALYCVRFNPSDVNFIAASAADNSVGLYDIRANSPLRKVVLQQRTNAIAWNPQNPLHFTAANEDSNLYTFDMRNLERALMVHKGFTNAVTDVDYNPAGIEFVAASFDKGVRLFSLGGKSRDAYFNRRMQNVLCCRYSLDGKFVCTGSSDMSVRIWKADASQKLGTITHREEAALNYRNALQEKYKHVPEIRRILKPRTLPAIVAKQTKIRQVKEAAKRRKEINKALHSKDPKLEQEKRKAIVKEVE
ncbi:Sof1-like domain family protein [Babesia bovis T2Bo]|uniref:DDB1- and CUL4-associated factor 13 n=1 Tax=Babesia bovis TaxID=5865 RepID=A7AQQ5_BABBO|nr:Sof1-like domain family protein [Babesia bovis T2Bo]EDO06874.1 Sof1-like domain family protein [Babesia bovis T2Bo]|eukprot:XP_001610442.1 ribosomal processing protein [Babesia bovis T2Bo]